MSQTLSLPELAIDIDAIVEDRVLVIGSVPPDARHLRLVAREDEYTAISTYLGDNGFVQRRSKWVRLEPGRVLAVELSRAKNWGLDVVHSGEVLFIGGVPLPGLRNLVRPAPHVVLVLAARTLLRGRGHLPAGVRRRAAEAARTGEDVWADARDLADRLRLAGPLRMLERFPFQSGRWTRTQRVRELASALSVGRLSARLSAAKALTPRRLRPLLVAFSGPDGSGKSTHAALLRQTLGQVGVSTAGAWAPTPLHPTLTAPLRAYAARRRRAGSTPAAQGSTRAVATAKRPLYVQMAEHAYICLVALSNAAEMWRHVCRWRTEQVLVLDRFVLDADVKLTYWYGHRRGVDIALERRLFRAICPPVDVAVFLAVAPETNYRRRADEWSANDFLHFQRLYAESARELRAVVVDAERPLEEVARDVADAVWRRLPGSSLQGTSA